MVEVWRWGGGGGEGGRGGGGEGGTASTWKPWLAQKTVQAYECQKSSSV